MKNSFKDRFITILLKFALYIMTPIVYLSLKFSKKFLMEVIDNYYDERKEK